MNALQAAIVDLARRDAKLNLAEDYDAYVSEFWMHGEVTE